MLHALFINVMHFCQIFILFSQPKEIKKLKRLPAVLALTASQTGWRKLKIIFHYSNLTITTDF